MAEGSACGAGYSAVRIEPGTSPPEVQREQATTGLPGHDLSGVLDAEPICAEMFYKGAPRKNKFAVMRPHGSGRENS